MKNIDNLVSDIFSVIDDSTWTEANTESLLDSLRGLLNSRLTEQPIRNTRITFSGMAGPCDRQLWYRFHREDTPFKFKGGRSRLKFLIGDIVEALLLELVRASGHSVAGEQTEVSIDGVPGRRDAVIDGRNVDIKTTTSNFTFDKFRDGSLGDSDAFGYLSQLSSYCAATLDDPLVTDKFSGSFLAYNMTSGSLCLDTHDMTSRISEKTEEIKACREMLSGPLPSKTTMKFACTSCPSRSRCAAEGKPKPTPTHQPTYRAQLNNSMPSGLAGLIRRT